MARRVFNDFQWTEEYLAQIVADGRTARERAGAMREQCRRLQERLLEQRERLSAVVARLELTPRARPGNSGAPGEF